MYFPFPEFQKRSFDLDTFYFEKFLVFTRTTSCCAARLVSMRSAPAVSELERRIPGMMLH